MTGTNSESDVRTERPLRVATWNMDHRRRTLSERASARQALHKVLHADIALLQECVHPEELPRTRVAYRELAGSRPWGTAVMACSDGIEVEEIGAVRTRYGARRFSMLGTIPGSIMVARALVPRFGPLTCVSVYGVMDVYAQTTMLRVAADLIPLFDSKDGEHVILGGDFNITATGAKDPTEARRFEAILKVVRSLGLEDLTDHARVRPARDPECGCGSTDCKHFRTFGASQLDYLFATKKVAQQCTKLELVPSDFSDHCALVAELDPVRLVALRHDPDSFAQLLTEQCGESVGRVAKELVAWAQRKDLGCFRGASLSRLPITEAETPELSLQLDLPGRRLQWMVSLRANGEGAVRFQHMLAPYDTEVARERLWEELNDIVGGTLEKRLNGRPTFPLAAVAQSERTGRLIAVLDRVVDETLEAERMPV